MDGNSRLGHGTITGGGPCVEVGGVLHRLPAERTPLRDWAARLLPCRHCGAVGGCGCEDWIEWMAAASAAEVTNDEQH